VSYRLKEPLVHAISGDHHFPDPCGFTFRADDFPALLSKITQYRLQNGLPVGDPEQEVLTFYAKSFPWSVIEEDGRKVLSQKHTTLFDNPDTNPAKVSQSLQERLYAWVNQVWRNPPAKLLAPQEAASRVSACKNCPQHLPPLSDTPLNDPRAKETDRRVFVLAKCRPASDALGSCAHFGWDCRLACLLPNPSGGGEKEPAGCWVAPQRNEMPKPLKT
jgi:hypothetical protein